jgi:hypothetical protein
MMFLKGGVQLTPEPLQLGTSNNAGTFPTSLISSPPAAAGPTLTVYNFTEGKGVRGISNKGYGLEGLQQGSISITEAGSSGGVLGTALGEAGNGVVGEANRGTSAYGVWGKSTSGWAGYFSGKVRVEGYLEKAGGGFVIDHPLDPENMYLRHSFVESPNALNIYRGTATTGEDGSATVALPEYVETLNADFHYQLTVVGDFAQAVVAEEISDNHFTIRTDQPKCKVCWQVTGVRKDAFARTHRMEVEEEKPPEKRGTYLHPGAFGQPETRGEDYSRSEALRLAQVEPQDELQRPQ